MSGPAGLGAIGAVLLLAQAAPLRFESKVRAVSVDVSVTRDGRPVSGLGAGDFEVRDDGVVQEVALAGSTDLPLRVTLVLDTSSSMAGARLDALRAAARVLLSGLRPDDRATLFSFSERARRHGGEGGAPAAVAAALSSVEAGGATSLHDALYVALAATGEQRGRTLVLLFTDGEDNLSWLSAEDVLERAARSDAVVHVVTGEPLAGRTAPSGSEHAALLARVASATGGRVWTAGARLEEAFAGILADMRARYLLTYEPAGAEPGWHRLEVRLRRGRGRVDARRGYFAGR